jgi:hypothetical protein
MHMIWLGILFGIGLILAPLVLRLAIGAAIILIPLALIIGVIIWFAADPERLVFCGVLGGTWLLGFLWPRFILWCAGPKRQNTFPGKTSDKAEFFSDYFSFGPERRKE